MCLKQKYTIENTSVINMQIYKLVRAGEGIGEP